MWVCPSFKKTHFHSFSHNVTTTVYHLHWTFAHLKSTVCQMFQCLWLSCFFLQMLVKNSRKNMNLAKSLQLHHTDMLSSYLAFFGMMESMNVVSPTLRTFDLDSSYTQIMIYGTKLLLSNYKQWIFRLWLWDHSSDAVTVCYVCSVLLNRKWHFIRKNKMHVMMKNPLGESH